MTLFTLSASACFKITPIVCAQVSRTGATTCQNRKKNTVYTRQYHEKWTRKLQETSSTSGEWLLFEVWIRLFTYSFSKYNSLTPIILFEIFFLEKPNHKTFQITLTSSLTKSPKRSSAMTQRRRRDMFSSHFLFWIWSCRKEPNINKKEQLLSVRER